MVRTKTRWNVTGTERCPRWRNSWRNTAAPLRLHPVHDGAPDARTTCSRRCGCGSSAMPGTTAPPRFRAWLYRICRNLDHRPSEKRKPTSALRIRRDATTGRCRHPGRPRKHAGEDAERSDFMVRIREAVETAASEQKEVSSCGRNRRFELSFRDIAAPAGVVDHG